MVDVQIHEVFCQSSYIICTKIYYKMKKDIFIKFKGPWPQIIKLKGLSHHNQIASFGMWSIVQRRRPQFANELRRPMSGSNLGPPQSESSQVSTQTGQLLVMMKTNLSLESGQLLVTHSR